MIKKVAEQLLTFSLVFMSISAVGDGDIRSAIGFSVLSFMSFYLRDPYLMAKRSVVLVFSSVWFLVMCAFWIALGRAFFLVGENLAGLLVSMIVAMLIAFAWSRKPLIFHEILRGVLTLAFLALAVYEIAYGHGLSNVSAAAISSAIFLRVLV